MERAGQRWTDGFFTFFISEELRCEMRYTNGDLSLLTKDVTGEEIIEYFNLNGSLINA
jgi:hypothetical protein